MSTSCQLIATLLISFLTQTLCLQIVLAGGTGVIGKGIASRMPHADVIILTRNAFLARTPNRVTEQFGWVGQKFLSKNRHVRLRDWDGGDLLDIVGQDWIGWQDDALKGADVVVHLVGGFTQQRVQACERLVRESLSTNPEALQITVNPLEQDLPGFSPGLASLKLQRIKTCENMVESNCRNHKCLRIEAYRVDQSCDSIATAIEEWTALKQ